MRGKPTPIHTVDINKRHLQLVKELFDKRVKYTSIWEAYVLRRQLRNLVKVRKMRGITMKVELEPYIVIREMREKSNGRTKRVRLIIE